MTIYLESDRGRVTIEPRAGGRVSSFVVDGREVIGSVSADVVDSVLGATDDIRGDWFWGSFPLAPWVGRLPRGRISVPDLDYRVESDMYHGSVAESEWSILGMTWNTAHLKCEFGPQDAGGWPFAGFAEQTFALDDSALRMTLEVHSYGACAPASVGFHPWFARSIDGGDASIEFSPRHRLELHDCGQWVTTDDLGERPWDDLFVDVDDSPVITWPGGPVLTLGSDALVWVYYEQLPGAFCIEPWSAPSGRLDNGQTMISPDRPLKLDFTIWFK